jgi:hypothetical protein
MRTKYGRDVFPVMARRCSECLFGENAIVSKKRRKAILLECERTDSHFECHKATAAGEEVCCRGFYETRSTNLIRVAWRLGVIAWIDPDTIEQVEE